jgi:hypothetical protein
MPDFFAQFRKPPTPTIPRVYMGGTAMSCGDHPSLPKRHRWGAWQKIEFHTGVEGWERCCKMCALVDDTRWTKPWNAVAASLRARDGGEGP